MSYKTPTELVKEMEKAVIKMAEAMDEFSRWEAYRSIKENPLQFNDKNRKEILEHSKGHITHLLFENLFRAYPLRPITLSPKESEQ